MVGLREGVGVEEMMEEREMGMEGEREERTERQCLPLCVIARAVMYCH